MSDVFLFTISLGLTALGLLGSWAAYKRRGAASGLRGAAWSTVPLAAYLTGVEKFIANLVLSPVKWAGVILFAVGFVLYLVSGVMLRRGGSAPRAAERAKEPGKDVAPGRRPKGAVERRSSAVDPEMAEIEKILRDRGIG